MSTPEDQFERGIASVRGGMRPRAQVDMTMVATLIQAAAINTCGECLEPILEFWRHCPQCGAWIDWDSESSETAQGSEGSG